MMATQLVKKCPLCGGADLSDAQITRKDGSKLDVSVCQSCGDLILPNSQYAYIITGVGNNWVSAEDLKGTIEDILGRWLLPQDRKDLKVEVVEIAE